MRNTPTIRMLALTGALLALVLAGCSREGEDWKSASLANTTESYQQFLQQHPQSAEALEAQGRIKQLTEDRDWQVAAAADNRDAYQQFVTQHPDSKWAQEARLRMENFSQAGVNGAASAGSAANGASAAASTGNGPAGATLASAAGAGASPAHGATANQDRSRSHHAVSSKLASSKQASRHATAATLSRARAGARWVQLGAFRSKTRAESEWKRLSARFAALKSLKPRYVAVRIKGGSVFRLQVRVSSTAAAHGLCESLRRHAQACVRVNA